MFAVIRFVLGAAAGSFLNVVILRYTPGANLFGRQLLGRSHCPRCGAQLRWFELLPILSFLVQRGRCRRCRGRISFQYPLVELAAGFIALGVPPFLHAFYEAAGIFTPPFLEALLSLVWVLIFLVLLTIVVIDTRHYLIPDALTIALAVFGAALIAVAYAAPGMFGNASFVREYALLVLPFQNILLTHAFGAFVGGAFFALFALLSRGRGMGWGDVKLAAAGGFVLGLPDILLSLFVAFIAGGLVGGTLLLLGRKRWRDKLPFGPFIVGGMVVTIFFGHQLLQVYFSLL